MPASARPRIERLTGAIVTRRDRHGQAISRRRNEYDVAAVLTQGKLGFLNGGRVANQVRVGSIRTTLRETVICADLDVKTA
jgi:hypothetical protein